MPKIRRTVIDPDAPRDADGNVEASVVTDESAVAGRQEGEPRDTDAPAAPSDQPDTDDTQDAQDDDEPVEAVRPKPSDSRGDWEAYAKLCGVTDDDITGARTKADLQALCDRAQVDPATIEG